MKTRSLAILSAVVILALVQMACTINIPEPKIVRGSGTVITEEREVTGIKSVSVCCGMRLELTQGMKESLYIEAEDNLMPYIESVVTGDKLEVRIKQDSALTGITTTKPNIVRLSVINIEGIEISGGGRLDSGDLDTDILSVDLSGGSKADFGMLEVGKLSAVISGGGHMLIQNAQAESVTADLSGGSVMEISGKAGSLGLEMSGGGRATASELQASTGEIDLSGGAKADVWVTDSITVTLSGGSVLNYAGSPTIERADVSGGSQLHSVD